MVLVVAPVEALVEAFVAEDLVVVALAEAYPLAVPAEAFAAGVPSEESLGELMKTPDVKACPLT